MEDEYLIKLVIGYLIQSLRFKSGYIELKKLLRVKSLKYYLFSG